MDGTGLTSLMREKKDEETIGEWTRIDRRVYMNRTGMDGQSTVTEGTIIHCSVELCFKEY